VRHATDAGAAIVTMGPRVLRSETAGIVAVTLALQATGALG
jgi:16S rRNA U1498 N3-methylase RsmE